MRSIENSFYRSKAWLSFRKMYVKEYPFCARCLMVGVYRPAEIVHHKIYLTEDNFKDPAISLNPDNCESVCRMHHNQIHKKDQTPRRWSFVNGELVMHEIPDHEPPSDQP